MGMAELDFTGNFLLAGGEVSSEIIGRSRVC